MRLASIVAVPLMVTATLASADGFGCSHTAPRRVAAAAAGVSRVSIIARAGSLRVTGRAGGDVVASGTACASDRDFLNEIKLEARRDGSELVIEALIPERLSLFNWSEGRLDFEVAVPANVPISVRDGSGPATISGVADVDVKDGSGELEIRNVRGNVKVHDGSGEMEIFDVGGEVEITDGSGEIRVERAGSVHVSEDGSGSIDIRNVQRDVRIDEDGSGSIDVADVRGNFTVDRDGSGGIDYARVAGRVSIPRD